MQLKRLVECGRWGYFASVQAIFLDLKLDFHVPIEWVLEKSLIQVLVAVLIQVYGGIVCICWELIRLERLR
jgi:hypothetical protein